MNKEDREWFDGKFSATSTEISEVKAEVAHIKGTLSGAKWVIGLALTILVALIAVI